MARRIKPHIPLLLDKPPELPVWQRRTSNLQHLRKRRQKMERAKALKTASELASTRAYRISRKLRHRIEHLFGEAKQSHGLSRARYRGLAKMNQQVTLTAIAQNLKRLVKFLAKPGRREANQGAVRPRPRCPWVSSLLFRLRFALEGISNPIGRLSSPCTVQPAPQPS